MLLGCSHLNRYRYRYSVSQSGSVSLSPSGSLSFLSLPSSFDPDPDSDFDIDAPSNIRIQGTRIRKQKMARGMRGQSRHAVARYRRRPRMRAEKRAAQRRGYTRGKRVPTGGRTAPAAGCVRKSAPHSGAATQTGLHPGRFRRRRPVALQFGNLPVPKAHLHSGRR